MSTTDARRIGPIGTVTRLLSSAALLYLALFDGTSWGLSWDEGALGLGVFPAAMVALGFVARLRGIGPIRFLGSVGMTLNCAVIVGLLVNRYTSGGAELFYGVTLLVAAWRAQPGCEATVISNWILGRDDQIGCPTFTPIDQAEARSRARKRRAKTPAQPSPLTPGSQ